MTTIFFFFIELDKELDGCGGRHLAPSWYRRVEPYWPISRTATERPRAFEAVRSRRQGAGRYPSSPRSLYQIGLPMRILP